MPDVSSTTKWLSSFSLQKKSSLWGCRPALVPTKSRAAVPLIGAQGSQWSSTVSVLIQPVILWPVLRFSSRSCWRETQWMLEPLLSFDHIFLGLHKSRLSFQLSNPFTGCSLLSFMPYPIWSFPRFSQARLSPLWSPFGFHWTCLIVLLPHLASTAHTVEEFLPCCASLHPLISGTDWLFPGGIAKQPFLPTQGINVPLAEVGGCSVPWRAREAAPV